MSKFMDFDEETVTLPVGTGAPRKSDSDAASAAKQSTDVTIENATIAGNFITNETTLLTLDEVERRHIMNVLAHTNGNKSEAAKILGITIKSVYNKLHDYEHRGHQLGLATIGTKSNK